MAESLGRSLLTREHVHHKDEDKTNNIRKNLKVMIRGKHQSMHMLGNSYKLGKHHSIESRRRMSTAQKGICPGVETKRKMSLVQRGKHHSIESRRKMSLVHMGMPSSRKGKHHTMEAKRKMSFAKKYYWLQQMYPGL